MIIGAVVLMLLLILNTSLPLFTQAEARYRHVIEKPFSDLPLAIGVADYGEVVYLLRQDGTVSFLSGAEGERLEDVTLPRPDGATRIVAVDSYGNHEHAARWDDNTVLPVRVRFSTEFSQAGDRSIAFRVTPGQWVPPPEPVTDSARVLVRTGDGGTTRVDRIDSDTLWVSRQIVSEDIFGNTSVDTQTAKLVNPGEGALTALELDSAGTTLYAGTEHGFLVRWALADEDDPVLLDVFQATDGTPISSLGMVFGDISVVVGQSDGTLSAWFPVTDPATGNKQLERIHPLPSHNAELLRISGSRRDKSVLSLDADGVFRMAYMTSERELARIAGPEPLTLYGLASRGETLAATGASGDIHLFELEKGHPHASWRTLFGKVWYENYDEPAFVWQSAASSDDYEPKLSLVPLIFGSFKGTLYAMLLAVPIALFGAVYTSQFLNPNLRRVVKPVVEIMASIPSVVVGFLIALWLAPIIEQGIVAFFLAIIILPLSFIPFIAIYQRFDGTWFARRVERGYEFIVVVPIMLLAVLAAWLLAGPVEGALFDGNFQQWLYDSLGERYDQRNAIIIAFGLGFAAIPIIFTIAEDALSNLPQSLRAASLALGASRWQTVWRVVLPSASPGIFAGIIIGFGRVIGETMIVLMATGNTPIMDWSIFNGMRTLSANIAVEIPEAPVGGTLYRVLFLSAVLLFLLTFVLNTVAEIIRQRLRQKYGRFQ